MTMSLATKWSSRPVGRVRTAAGWLGLAAAPTYALMAGIAAHGSPRFAICSMASGMLPIDGMASMYLLMSVFHLAPWLKLAFR